MPETPATGLTRIHRVVTRGLNVSLERSRRWLPGGIPDTATRRGFALYVQSLVAVLGAHHLTEDEIAFLHFRAILPDPIYSRLTADHQEMHRLLGEVRRALGDLPGERERPALSDLAGALGGIADLWGPHIAAEEAHITDERLGRVMGAEEQGRLLAILAKHSQEHAQPNDLTVPFMLFNLAPDDRAAMAESMPPVVTQQLVPVAWKDRWAPMQPYLLE